jgi:hypothetical protein
VSARAAPAASSTGAWVSSAASGAVRGQHGGHRQQQPPHGVDGVGVEEPVTVGGHHDRVHDQRDGRVHARPARRDGADDRGGRQHPGLGGADREVGQHRVDLSRDQLGVQGVGARDRERVLGGDRRDGRAAEQPVGGEGAEIGLDAGAAAGVGARDGQRAQGTLVPSPHDSARVAAVLLDAALQAPARCTCA